MTRLPSASDLTYTDCLVIERKTWGKSKSYWTRATLSIGVVRLWGDGRISTPCGTSTLIPPRFVWWQVHDTRKQATASK